jgi:hypothetical protein
MKSRLDTYLPRPAQYTLHPTPYTPHPTPYTLHPTPDTWSTTPQTVKCVLCTINRENRWVRLASTCLCRCRCPSSAGARQKVLFWATTTFTASLLWPFTLRSRPLSRVGSSVTSLPIRDLSTSRGAESRGKEGGRELVLVHLCTKERCGKRGWWGDVYGFNLGAVGW